LIVGPRASFYNNNNNNKKQQQPTTKKTKSEQFSVSHKSGAEKTSHRATMFTNGWISIANPTIATTCRRSIKQQKLQQTSTQRSAVNFPKRLEIGARNNVLNNSTTIDINNKRKSPLFFTHPPPRIFISQKYCATPLLLSRM
jgi:hypothetical protein